MYSYPYANPIFRQVPQGMTPMPSGNVMPKPSTISNFQMQPESPVGQDINYTQGYLRTQIGKKVRIEFLIGTSSLTDRIGVLMEVGISYVIIKLTDSDDLQLCDIYAIKFVTIYK